MKGNNRGRIFMSLINHVLCLSVLCLHPSCPASLLPSHFKSHSLYLFTNPSEKTHKTRAIGMGKKEGCLCFYLFICLHIHHVVLWRPGLDDTPTQRTEFTLWIIGGPVHISLPRQKASQEQSVSTQVWNKTLVRFYSLHLPKLFAASGSWCLIQNPEQWPTTFINSSGKMLNFVQIKQQG